MKPSPYNHFFEANEGRFILAYNSFTGALAEIERENYSRVQQLLAHPDQAATAQDHEFLQCLKDGGFLIPDAVDQLVALRTKARSLRLEGTLLALTVAPTLACNFDCNYCYESRSNVRMSEETQEALIRFTDHHLRRAGALRICWFGGEPTLCFGMIERLQTRLLELAQRHHADIVPGTIITNGYLMDEAMARRLKELQVTQAQISIDGPRPVHDSRRKLRNGGGTFDRILDNLAATCDILDVNVRINVDKGNVDSAYEVVEVMQGRGILPKVRVTFAQVTSSGEACSGIRDRCYDSEEFARNLVQIHGRLLEHGINRVDPPRVLGGIACGALASGNFVVSPTGHLFRCWEDLSMDARKSIGDLFSHQPEPGQEANLEAYRSWDPLKLPECKTCGVLPICLGGCPVSGMQKAAPVRGDCVYWKYNLREMLGMAYSTMAPPAPGE